MSESHGLPAPTPAGPQPGATAAAAPDSRLFTLPSAVIAVAAAWLTALACQAAFAADGDARLAWFYERTPFYDDHYLLYPVGRED